MRAAPPIDVEAVRSQLRLPIRVYEAIKALLLENSRDVTTPYKGLWEDALVNLGLKIGGYDSL